MSGKAIGNDTLRERPEAIFASYYPMLVRRKQTSPIVLGKLVAPNDMVRVRKNKGVSGEMLKTGIKTKTINFL